MLLAESKSMILLLHYTLFSLLPGEGALGQKKKSKSCPASIMHDMLTMTILNCWMEGRGPYSSTSNVQFTVFEPRCIQINIFW